MQSIKSKIDEFSKFFAKKEVGIRIYKTLADADSAPILPLKILSTSLSFEKEISEIPLERTKVINDNIRVKPKKISVQILVNDFSATFLGFQVGALIRGHEVNQILGELRTLRETAYFLDVITLTDTFKYMQLIKYDYEENATNGGKYLLINLECQEIMTFVTLQNSEDNKKAIIVTSSVSSGMSKLAGRFAKILA